MSKKRKKSKGNPAKSAPRGRVLHLLSDDGVTRYSGDSDSFKSFYDEFMYQWIAQIENVFGQWFGMLAKEAGIPVSSGDRWVCQPAVSDLSGAGSLGMTIKGFDPEIWRRTVETIQGEEPGELTAALTEVTGAVVIAALERVRLPIDIPISFAVGYAEDALRIQVNILPPLGTWLFKEVAA